MAADVEPSVLAKLTEFTRDELVSEQEAADITATTPLLQWGVLKSLETARMIAYIREEFDVFVPPTHVTNTNFRDLESIAAMVHELRATA
jgi:acyl carrier protein